jgi:demethylspheroidene O-methyltransferase
MVPTDDGRLRPRPSLRDRIFTSPRFQRWAAAFPLTRPIARRRAGAAFDLVAGFVYSQILLACIRLHLLDILYEGPQDIAALAPRLGLSEEAARRLLDAAVALRLARRRSGGRYALGPVGVGIVGQPGVAAMVEHHGLLYADLRDPVALLRGERSGTDLGRYWPYAGEAGPAPLQADQVAGYTALMAASQPLVSAEVLDAIDLGRYRCLLDVGGGDGTFLSAVAARVPSLWLMLFDLPAVADRARARFAASGLACRAAVTGGDFRTDALPTGADIVSLVRILHDHDDDTVRALLHAVRDCLPPGGTVLVAEPMARTPGAEAVGDAYFGFYLLAMGRGRPRTFGEIADLLKDAGFEDVRAVRTRTPMIASLAVGRVARSSQLL